MKRFAIYLPFTLLFACNSDGDAADGDATDGTATDGTATDGTATDGTATDGTATDGTATDGTATDGTATDGTETDGEVADTCETTTLNCGAHGTCSDESGAPECVCDTGYAGMDCTLCDGGYQDNDGDGTCTESCAGSSLDCGEDGTCSDLSGTAECSCHTGYAGTDCSACATGYQDEDSDGSCLEDCASASLSCGDGSCIISGGAPTCDCPSGQASSDCTLCAPGYQDNDDNGTCTENCTTAALSCGENGVCSDALGTAECSCATGYDGAGCDVCAAGFQDDDGNGVCTEACDSSEWLDPAYLNRMALTLTNDLSTPLPAGTAFRVVIDHASLVTSGASLASGDDVRVAYNGGASITEIERTSETGWNLGSTDVVFALQSDIAPGSTTTDYWLYWNNAAATVPTAYVPPAKETWATSVTDSSTLGCRQIGSGFLSIQLRQKGPNSNQFQVFVREHTNDPGSFGRILITDDADDGTIFAETYAENSLGGSCCSPVVNGFGIDDITIDATDFTVELESNEFSNSRRIFGCEIFATAHPAGAETTIRSYTIAETPRPLGSACGL